MVAGVDVRTISVYAIHRDKVIIADRRTVEQGSFKYSDAAAHRNSENVLVNWGNPKLAEVCLKHFERNYAQATAYVQGYRGTAGSNMASLERLEATGPRGESVIVIRTREEIDTSSLEGRSSALGLPSRDFWGHDFWGPCLWRFAR